MRLKKLYSRLHYLLTFSLVFALRRLKLRVLKEDWVASNPDENIFHVLYDTIVYYSPYYREIHILDQSIDKNSRVQKWRLFFLQKVYPQKKIKYVKSTPIKPSLELRMGYDHNVFINYPVRQPHFSIVQQVCSKEKGEYILFNQRGIDDRYLYESVSGLPLEDFLRKQSFGRPLKICSFHDMSPEEQYQVCSKALLFISAHGAGCTNIIFTPLDCPLIEISQRTNWFCDPICDDHFYSKIGINEPCAVSMINKSQYHKADFHNLCFLIGKNYTEIEPLRYEGVFKARKPIAKQKIFVDGQSLLNTICQHIDCE